MKLKITFSLGLSIIALFSFSPRSLAAGIPITGTAYSEEIGVIHFDYKTAETPSNDPLYQTDSKYYIGPTKQFYVSPYDSSFTPQNPYVTGNANITVQISTDTADCINNSCLLKGFAWSDTIGWIVFDGSVINNAISKAINLPAADEETANDPYRNYMYPRISTQADASGRLAVTGYAWNEHAGWIRFSSDDLGATGVTTDTDSQQPGNWGVWLDGSSSIERVITNPGPPPVEEKIGRRFHGYGWSENLGWIKFSKEAVDSFAFDFSAYTLWIPDDTPPIILANDEAWFAPGTNNGFPSKTTVPTNIYWEHFAIDPESGVNEKQSKFHLKPDPNFGNCKTPPAFGAQNIASVAQLTHAIPGGYPVTGGGDVLDVVIPTIGNLKGTNQSYCKYELHAEIVNHVNDSFYIGDHFLPTAPVPANQKQAKITIYVRAGDFTEDTSDIKLITTTGIVADGKEAIQYEIEFNDIAGNPIVPVDCSAETLCSGKVVKLTANVTNELTYDLNQSPSSSAFTPIKYANSNVAQTGVYMHRDDSVDPSYDPINDEWNIEINPTANLKYPLEIASYGPTSHYDIANKSEIDRLFSVNGMRYEFQADVLPGTSRELSRINPTIQFTPAHPSGFNPSDPFNPITGIRNCIEPAQNALQACPNNDFSTNPSITNYRIKNIAQLPNGIFSQKAVSADFIAPISLKNGQIESGGIANTFSVGSPTTISFDVANISQKSITAANFGGLSIEHIFQFYSPKPNPLLSLMEIHRIQNKSSNDSADPDFGWTDPFQPFDLNTRYEMYMQNGDYFISPQQANPISYLKSPFKNFIGYFFDYGVDYLSAYANFTPSFISSYNPPNTTDLFNSDGNYLITGREGIPQAYSAIDPMGSSSDPYNYPPGKIDRQDGVNLDLSTGSPQTPATNRKSIEFTAEKLINQPISDIKLQVINQIAYRFPEQLLFSVYSTKDPLFKDLNVQDLGLEAIGTVAGEQNVIGRQFETVGTAGAQQLQEQVRRNVAEILSGNNLNAVNCPIPANPIGALPTSGNCVIEDSVNGTKVAYFEGDENETLTIGNGSNLFSPAEPYTLIVKGGANLFISENLLRNGPFGIILIADEIGRGSDVYISPTPTNIQAVLYTEGSLISRNSSGAFYYGSALGDINELSNQLYWQGSIASRNTIGGAGQQRIPAGITCPGETPLNCAQRYDLDYLRRFTVSIDSTAPSSNIASNGLFSGGGSCSNGQCTAGALPSTITLNGTQIDEPNSELSPVFVAPDNQVVNNPPPGFSRTSSLDSNQVIR